jgi:hypothetical protein
MTTQMYAMHVVDAPSQGEQQFARLEAALRKHGRPVEAPPLPANRGLGPEWLIAEITGPYRRLMSWVPWTAGTPDAGRYAVRVDSLIEVREGSPRLRAGRGLPAASRPSQSLDATAAQVAHRFSSQQRRAR